MLKIYYKIDFYYSIIFKIINYIYVHKDNFNKLKSIIIKKYYN